MPFIFKIPGKNKEQRMSTDWKQEAQAAQSKAQQYEKVFDALSKAPQARYARVVAGPFKAIDEEGLAADRIIVAAGGEHASVMAPKEIVKKKLPVGTLVRLDPKGVILGIEEEAGDTLGGVLVSVRKVEEKYLHVEVGSGANRVVVRGAAIKDVEPGHQVEVDPGFMVAYRSLGIDQTRFQLPEQVSVHWDAIGGQEQAKAVLREAIEGATANPALYKAYGRRPVKGALLWGPPGCGKTLLAKAAATAFAALQNGPAGFFYVKGPEILSMYVGESERMIRDLFTRARAHYTKTGTRGLLFIDEADAILSARGTQRSSDVDKTIVPAFLAEMDGMDEGSPFTLLATNRQNALDPAVVRDGRIDRKVPVLRPDLKASKDILSIYLKDKPLQGTLAKIAQDAVEDVFSGRHEVKAMWREEAGKAPTRLSFTLERIVSGAMLAGLVDRATEKAMRRDIKEGAKRPSGITSEDLASALLDIAQAERGVSHNEDVVQWAAEKEIALDRLRVEPGRAAAAN